MSEWIDRHLELAHLELYIHGGWQVDVEESPGPDAPIHPDLVPLRDAVWAARKSITPLLKEKHAIEDQMVRLCAVQKSLSWRESLTAHGESLEVALTEFDSLLKPLGMSSSATSRHPRPSKWRALFMRGLWRRKSLVGPSQRGFEARIRLLESKHHEISSQLCGFMPALKRLEVEYGDKVEQIFIGAFPPDAQIEAKEALAKYRESWLQDVTGRAPSQFGEVDDLVFEQPPEPADLGTHRYKRFEDEVLNLAASRGFRLSDDWLLSLVTSRI